MRETMQGLREKVVYLENKIAEFKALTATQNDKIEKLTHENIIEMNCRKTSAKEMEDMRAALIFSNGRAQGILDAIKAVRGGQE